MFSLVVHVTFIEWRIVWRMDVFSVDNLQFTRGEMSNFISKVNWFWSAFVLDALIFGTLYGVMGLFILNKNECLPSYIIFKYLSDWYLAFIF